MVFRIVFFACIQALYLQHAYAQAIFPACQSQVSVTETCQTAVNQPTIVAQPVCATPYELEYVGSYAVPPVVIQNDSIANDLANALQLLVVSNLLGNTLPFNKLGAFPQPGLIAQPNLLPAVPLTGPTLQVASLGQPTFVGGCGCGGLNYII